MPDEEARFIRNGRDLAAIAFGDLLYTEAFRAALIMFRHGILSSAEGPYSESERQVGFATFGEPHILTAMAASSSSTRHAWYAKVSAEPVLPHANSRVIAVKRRTFSTWLVGTAPSCVSQRLNFRRLGRISYPDFPFPQWVVEHLGVSNQPSFLPLSARLFTPNARTPQWQVHRLLRPEAYGGLVHNTLTPGRPNTSLPKSLLENTVSHPQSPIACM